MKRVYHPTLASYQDVADDAVDSWVEAGWRKTAPKHINADLLPEVGSSPGVAAAPSESQDFSAVVDTGTATATATTSTRS